MQPDSSDQTNGNPASLNSATPKSRSMALLRGLAVTSFVGCAALGFLLYQAGVRERELKFKLSTSEHELEGEQRVRRRYEKDCEVISSDLESTRTSLQAAVAGRDELKRALQQTKAEHDEAQRTMISTRTALREAQIERDELRSSLLDTVKDRDAISRSLTTARSELSDCDEALESALIIARNHRDKLDEISSAIRIGMIGLSDIPSKRLTFGGGFDLESEYRKVIDDYNDLVRRFNAAVERSNDLGEIVNSIVRILR